MANFLIFFLIWVIISLVLSVIQGNNCEIIFHRYKGQSGIKFVPAIWFNDCLETPGFAHSSIVLRWFDFYIGLQIKF